VVMALVKHQQMYYHEQEHSLYLLSQLQCRVP
jgi:hypothetical protein